MLACNALDDNNGIGFDRLPTPLKREYEEHIYNTWRPAIGNG